ncbi:MAG: anti-sigma factor family protein, partial [Anaerolineales bacterium]
MLKSLYRFDCLTPQEIGEFHLGLIPPSARTQFEQHLQGCPHCQTELAALRRFMETEAIRPFAAPEPSLADKVGGWVQELVATLLPPTP